MRRGYPPGLRNGSPRRQAPVREYTPRCPVVTSPDDRDVSRLPGSAAGRGVRRRHCSSWRYPPAGAVSSPVSVSAVALPHRQYNRPLQGHAHIPQTDCLHEPHVHTECPTRPSYAELSPAPARARRFAFRAYFDCRSRCCPSADRVAARAGQQGWGAVTSLTPSCSEDGKGTSG